MDFTIDSPTTDLSIKKLDSTEFSKDSERFSFVAYQCTNNALRLIFEIILSIFFKDYKFFYVPKHNEKEFIYITKVICYKK